MAMEENIKENGNTGEWSIVPLTTSSQPVDSAISKIEELANRLVDAVEFSEGQQDFQELASSLIELESDRLQLHNDLEIQTINASVKRHALTEYPAKFQKELNEAVLAARLGNEETMKTLQAKLSNTTCHTDKLQEQHRSLQEENSRLLPERNQVTKQHDEIIAALNQRMADKAGKQIKLNESKDALRDTETHLGDYDIGMQNLEDDMAEFQEESQTEEKKLLLEVAETQDAIEQQKQKNSEEKRTTDSLADKITEMNGKISEVQKDIRRTENSHARLDMQSMQLNQRVDRERLINQQTAEEIEVLTATKKKQEIEYESKIKELEKKILKVQGELSIVHSDHDALLKTKDNKYLEKTEASRKKAKELARVKEVSIIVQATKQKTTQLIEKAALLSQENEQCIEDLRTLDENHKATVETYNLQIADYRENLNAERKERIKAQDEREETEKALDEFRNEQVVFMNDMTKKIEEGRRKHKFLVNESSKYNEDIAKNKKRTQILSTDLAISQQAFENMKSELEIEIERLKTNIELFKSDNKKKEEYLAEKRPLLKDLEEEIESTSKDYNVLKNEVVAVRNKQKSVQETLNRTQLMLKKLENPCKKLKSDIIECRECNLSELKKQAGERKILEAEIYDRTMKLENVVGENDRFKNSCDEKMQEVEEIKMDIRSHGHYQALLHTELEKLRKEFMDAWDICVQMEKESSEQDDEILKGIDHLQHETKNRSNVLTEISDHLQHEMESLTGFLENVNSRRPKDTRQQKRSSVYLRSVRMQSNRKSMAAVSSSRLRLTPVPPPPSPKPSSLDTSKPICSRSSIASVAKA